MAGQFIKFSEDLIRTEELDPVYSMLYNAKDQLGEDRTKRFLTAFYMFYHIGVASQLAEVPSNEFWDKVLWLYPTAKRGKERRHFRGAVGYNSIKSIRKYGSPENFIDAMIKPKFLDIRANMAKNVNGFGDYMIWKVADMQDRVLGYSVNWTGAEKFLHKVPIQGAQLIAMHENLTGGVPVVIEYMLSQLSHLKAPPTFNRTINIAEIETILCAYKGLVNGTYVFGSDILSKRKSLEGYGDLAEYMIDYLPDPVPTNKPTSSLESFYV